MSTRPTLPLNADTLNAMHDAMGALTMCISKQLSPSQRQEFSGDLAKLAQSAERAGRTDLEMILIDLYKASM